MITGIVVALPEELKTLTSKRIDKGHCVFIADKLLVAYSGAGYNNAALATELLISKGATQLMSWGCAAALSTLLKSGDLVLPDSLIDVDDKVMLVDQAWHDYAKSFLMSFTNVKVGKLTESTTIISSSREKQQLELITGSIALDMESIAIAKVAEKKGLPFLAIRVIVDPVNMDLPRAVSYALSPDGYIILHKLILFLILHPIELSGLIRLGLYFNNAQSTLKRIAKQLEILCDFK